jgi:hypothetical protein
MDVAMKYRLAGDLTDICADVEPLDLRLARQDVEPALFQQPLDRHLLLRIQMKVAGDVLRLPS